MFWCHTHRNSGRDEKINWIVFFRALANEKKNSTVCSISICFIVYVSYHFGSSSSTHIYYTYTNYHRARAFSCWRLFCVTYENRNKRKNMLAKFEKCFRAAVTIYTYIYVICTEMRLPWHMHGCGCFRGRGVFSFPLISLSSETPYRSSISSLIWPRGLYNFSHFGRRLWHIERKTSTYTYAWAPIANVCVCVCVCVNV